jgi:hypothetical protein
MGYTLEDLCNRGPEPTMQLLLTRIPKRATATYGEIARMLQRELAFGKSKIFPVHIGSVAGQLMISYSRNTEMLLLLISLSSRKEDCRAKDATAMSRGSADWPRILLRRCLARRGRL